MGIILNLSTHGYELIDKADQYAALYDRLSAVLPTETLTTVTEAVTAHRIAQNTAQSLDMPHVETVRNTWAERLTDLCKTGDGYTVADLADAVREINDTATLADTGQSLVTSIAWTAAQRVVTAWHTTGRTVLSGLRNALAARSDDLAELARMIPADFNDGHAFHAREELQQAWRELSTMDAFVSLALDVERTHRVNQPGDPAVSTVVQLVEDPITHGGNANDLGLTGLGWPTLPDDGRHRLRVLGRRGARLTLRTYREARAWVDRHFYDLPNMDTRANLIRELDNRWTDAA
ncbi:MULTISPECIES: hypothetical protein [Saccharothrix]|uniref:hypothetical protein n=1 Tax=Saccharothrix TaxID=2071 RepID=UPI00093D1425|nr:hypothetical protein [Saccharothrix sp. CB00851]OKI33336.1 hypothetical protein A6A25_06075 [Saccharothrix sp. CB00851]